MPKNDKLAHSSRKQGIWLRNVRMCTILSKRRSKQVCFGGTQPKCALVPVLLLVCRSKHSFLRQRSNQMKIHGTFIWLLTRRSKRNLSSPSLEGSVHQCPFRLSLAEVAQLVEQSLRKGWVAGSIPAFGSKKYPPARRLYFLGADGRRMPSHPSDGIERRSHVARNAATGEPG